MIRVELDEGAAASALTALGLAAVDLGKTAKVMRESDDGVHASAGFIDAEAKRVRRAAKAIDEALKASVG